MKLLTLESETVEVKPGEVVIRQGEAIGPMCIVEEGRLRVWEQQGTRQRERAFLRKGDMFGELAIARNQPRQASVEALTECRLITINEKI